MLVLSRKANEQIVVNGDVVVTVVSIQGNRVRLGVEAPPEVPIDRGEVHSRKVLEDEFRQKTDGHASVEDSGRTSGDDT